MVSDEETGFSSYTGDAPPHVETILREFALKVIHLARRWHPDVPKTAAELAAWWPTMQDPPHDREAPRQKEGKWICPYHERLVFTLSQFVLRPAEEQAIIIEASKDNVYWRGDDIAFFARVWDETLKMREMGIAEYRRHAIDKMKDLTLSA